MSGDDATYRRTFYEGPVQVSSFAFGSRSIQLVRPVEPDRLLDDPTALEWNRREDYMPYWAYLWPGAFLLAEAVAAEPWEPGLDALEIGCGLGLAGLVGVGRGLRVTFSDHDLAPLEFVTRSARFNGFDPQTFATLPLDWRFPPPRQYPVIFGADVLYERRLVPLVADLLARVLSPRGLAMIADPGRSSATDFDALLAARGLVDRAVPIVAQGEDGEVRGFLHRVVRARPDEPTSSGEGRG